MVNPNPVNKDGTPTKDLADKMSVLNSVTNEMLKNGDLNKKLLDLVSDESNRKAEEDMALALCAIQKYEMLIEDEDLIKDIMDNHEVDRENATGRIKIACGVGAIFHKIDGVTAVKAGE